MKTLRRCFLIHLAFLSVCYSGASYAATTSLNSRNLYKDNLYKGDLYSNNQSYFNIAYLYVKPSSTNLKYATYVAGTQPFYQSWHYLETRPSFHPAFELGLNYAIKQTPYSASLIWTHIYTNDSSSKQTSTNTNLSTVEFVGPPYEMSPPVFGIKHVDNKVNFNFNNILLNVGKLLEVDSNLQIKYFGGLDFLNLHQTLTTTFSDYAGSPATSYSYALPPDPAFSFETENVSKYFGVGPDIGLNARYLFSPHCGIFGGVIGSLTTGTIQTEDNFTSTSARLTLLGIGTSHQEITSPDSIRVVVGADGKLGLFYDFNHPGLGDFTFELGYRMASYYNAISTIAPNTLVQPGTVFSTPEFSTGTMAIVSTNATSHPFDYSGFFFNVKIAV